MGRLLLTTAIWALVACTGDGPSPADQGASPDVALERTPESDAEAPRDATDPPDNAVLLLDFEMRDPIVWGYLIDGFEGLGYDVSYRRWFPHVTTADVAAPSGSTPYRWIVIAAGGSPGRSSEGMRPAAVEALAGQILEGGGVLLLTRHGWLDSVVGENEWFFFNRLLETANVPLRISRDALLGDVVLEEPGLPPLHQDQPWAYAGTLEWTLQLPIGYPASDHVATGHLVDPMALGYLPTLACRGAEVEVLAVAHRAVIQWHYLGDHPEQISFPERELPIAALAATGPSTGPVAIVPQSLMQLPAHTELASDRPVLDLDLLDATEALTDAVLTHLAAIDADRSAHAPQGCEEQAQQGLFSVAAPGWEPLGDGPRRDTLFEVNDRATPEAPPSGTLATLPGRAEGPGPAPDWFVGAQARITYGDHSALPDETETFAAAAAAGSGTAVVSMPYRWVLDFDPDAVDPPFASVVAAAEATGTTLFVAIRWQDLYTDAVAELGHAIGPHGERLSASPPLHEALWSDWIEPLFQAAARLTDAHPAVLGLSIDTELYNAEQVWYGQLHAFDPAAWRIALDGAAAGDADVLAQGAALPLGERLYWLVGEGLAGLAFEALETAVAEHARRALEGARDIAPDFEVLLYSHALSLNWFYRGLIRGLGSADNPLVLLSYDMATEQTRERLATEGLHTRLPGGVLGVRFSPDDLQDALYHAGVRADGYWLFSFGDFPGGLGPEGGAGRHAHPDAYWEAVQRANQRLDAQ
jgi:hypothetical protein